MRESQPGITTSKTAVSERRSARLASIGCGGCRDLSLVQGVELRQPLAQADLDGGDVRVFRDTTQLAFMVDVTPAGTAGRARGLM